MPLSLPNFLLRHFYLSRTVGHKMTSGKSILMKNALSTVPNFEQYDEEQVKLMSEQCIEVDTNDNVIGPRSKLDCHLMKNGPPLHRAFSLFLFNTNGDLLMQKRAASKITFPGYFTNTCCSHPLFTEDELQEADGIGAKIAARRRVLAELGIVPEQLPLSCINYLTRIHYSAPSDGMWGENEIDYILFAQADVDLVPNPNEVSQIQYVSKEGMVEFIADCGQNNVPITPWFQLIADEFLNDWWDNLPDMGKCYNPGDESSLEMRTLG